MVSNEVRGGLYVSLRDHATFQIVPTGTSLTLNWWPNKLNGRYEGDKLIFENPIFGKDVWQRVEPWKPTNLEAFVGAYTSDEAQTHLRVEIKGKELTLHKTLIPGSLWSRRTQTTFAAISATSSA